VTTPINKNQALFLRWYEEYRERRYLAGVPDSELMQRSKDLLRNITTLTADGKIGVIPVDQKDGFFLWRLYSHLLEECRLRTGDPTGLFKKYGLKDSIVPTPTSPFPPTSPDILQAAADASAYRWILKFGERDRIHELLTRGQFRIAPASLYGDPSLGSAIADDELSYDLASSMLKADIKLLHPFEVRLSDVLGPVGTTRYRATLATDYFVWCTASVLDIRLFEDFNVDAALVIKNPLAFTDRLLKEVRKELPGWSFTFCTVNYFDPYHPTMEAASVFRSKKFSYMYQKELRFVFLPPKPVTALMPIYVELGPLLDIACAFDHVRGVM
jgi:hypothetical protein